MTVAASGGISTVGVAKRTGFGTESSDNGVVNRMLSNSDAETVPGVGSFKVSEVCGFFPIPEPESI
jgi:hypothetical protein